MPTVKIRRKILIIEDDKSLSIILRKEIEEYLGFEVHVALDGEIGLEKAIKNEYSLIISDISLPKLSGFSIVQRLKNRDIKTPVIVITNYNQEQNETLTYKTGANLFHKKPLNFDLLKAQINMLINSYKFYPQIKIGDIIIDPIKKVFKKNNHLIPLASKEFNFMLTLASSPGEVFTRKEIIGIHYGNKIDIEEASVDTLVSRLRKRIGKYKNKEVIETVYKNGYRLNLNYLEE